MPPISVHVAGSCGASRRDDCGGEGGREGGREGGKVLDYVQNIRAETAARKLRRQRRKSEPLPRLPLSSQGSLTSPARTGSRPTISRDLSITRSRSLLFFFFLFFLRRKSPFALAMRDVLLVRRLICDDCTRGMILSIFLARNSNEISGRNRGASITSGLIDPLFAA